MLNYPKKSVFTIITAILVILCFCSNIHAKNKNTQPQIEKSLRDVYVFSKKASLYEEPNVKSKQIKVIKSGDVLTVYEEKGYWLLVKTKEDEGWISKFLVSEYQPRDAKVRIAQIKKTLKRNARRRASSYSSAAAARGLSKENAVTGSITEDMESIKDLEKNQVSDEEVKEFIKKGNLEKK